MTQKLVKRESNDAFNPGATIKNGKIVVLYRAEDKSGIGIYERTSRIGYDESSDGINMKRRNDPVLYPSNDSQKEFEWLGGCEDPFIDVTDKGLHVVFYTEWNRIVPRLGVTTSKDLLTWTKHGPILKRHSTESFSILPAIRPLSLQKLFMVSR